jgi:hypothetical protein
MAGLGSTVAGRRASGPQCAESTSRTDLAAVALFAANWKASLAGASRGRGRRGCVLQPGARGVRCLGQDAAQAEPEGGRGLGPMNVCLRPRAAPSGTSARCRPRAGRGRSMATGSPCWRLLRCRDWQVLRRRSVSGRSLNRRCSRRVFRVADRALRPWAGLGWRAYANAGTVKAELKRVKQGS